MQINPYEATALCDRESTSRAIDGIPGVSINRIRQVVAAILFALGFAIVGATAYGLLKLSTTGWPAKLWQSATVAVGILTFATFGISIAIVGLGVLRRDKSRYLLGGTMLLISVVVYSLCLIVVITSR